MTLDEQIENTRAHMIKIAADKGIRDPRVIQVSMKLDKLINEFLYRSRKKSQVINIIVSH
ncbi:aspartyl-phosphate phosphatase Spo0E family protein [Desulfosporosinus sp. SYSU MS00001]|uniref:aspartyl-phosphate phosphatase Spo0E family protein n=1 Tax=Desulfosporosinus sp. SYSU MS00001 TaxID=3416284 RepID=UPI003CEB4F19